MNDLRARIAESLLYVLIDGGENETAFSQMATGLVAVGTHVLQLRDKRLSDRELLCRARILRKLTRGTRALFIMNDRPDLAVLSDADGVHVGQDELCVRDVRRIVGPEFLVGVSTHDISQARQAVHDGADYIGCGPTFPSGTKRFERFPGLELLRQVAQAVDLPAFAIGGISSENLDQVLQTGITRGAVAGAVVQSDDPDTTAKELLERLEANNKR